MKNQNEKRRLKNKQLLEALAITDKTLERVKNPKKDSDELDINAYETSSIKHFEICYELFWKYLKLILEEDYQTFVASPKNVFHECLKQKLISPNESKLLLEMVDDRNTTSHIYNKILAKEVFKGIDIYLELMNKIVDEIDSK